MYGQIIIILLCHISKFIPEQQIAFCKYSLGVYPRISMAYQGRSQDLAGGGPRILEVGFGSLHVVKRHAAHGEAMRFTRGGRGMLPRENFLKWCNLVRFMYIWIRFCLKKISKITIYYNVKNTIFYIKNRYFRYMLAME